MNALKLIGAIFILGSILLLGAGGYAYYHTKKFLANSVAAKGTVVDLAPRSSRSGGPTYAPVVRFTFRQIFLTLFLLLGMLYPT